MNYKYAAPLALVWERRPRTRSNLKAIDRPLPQNYAQRYDATGYKVGGDLLVGGPESTINFVSGDQPSVVGLQDGGFLITWPSGNDVEAQRYDASSNPVGTVFRVNSATGYSVQEPSATALSGGGFLVTWAAQGEDGDGYGVFGQQFDAEGNKAGGEFPVNSYTLGNEAYSHSAQLNNGKVEAYRAKVKLSFKYEGGG